MNEYQHDIFYKTDHLNLRDKKKLLREAFKKSFYSWTDILDCNKSWTREKIY